MKSKLKGHQKRITGLAFSTNLNILVSSGADAQVSGILYIFFSLLGERSNVGFYYVMCEATLVHKHVQ